MVQKLYCDYPIQCIVAEFDILGFKNIISAPKNHLNIKQIADSYEMYFTRNILYSKENLEYKPHFQIFSDTAITYQKYLEGNGNWVDDYKKNIFDFFKHLCIIMVNSIFAFTDSDFFANRMSEFPIRGGVSIGDMIIKHVKNNCSPILMGKPIVDAYEWEQTQNWLGLSINPNSIEDIKQVLNDKAFFDKERDNNKDYWQKLLDKNLLVEYDVPTKKGPIKTFVINFVPNNKQDILINELNKSVDKYKDEPEIQQKYQETKQFVEYVINRHKEIEPMLLQNGFSNI